MTININKKVGVIGDFFFDMVAGYGNWDKKNKRLWLSTNSPMWSGAGGAGTVARGINSMGIPTKVYGCLGNDFSGKAINMDLANAGINIEKLFTTSEPTMFRGYLLKGENSYIDIAWGGEVDCELNKISSRQNWSNSLKTALKENEMVVISDFSKIFLDSIKLGPLLDYSGSLIVSSKRPNIYNKLPSQAIMICSRIDLLKEGVAFNEIIEWMKTRKNIMTIVTCDKDGVIALLNNRIIKLASSKKELIFSVGAGDWFTSIFSVELFQNNSLEEALISANKKAGESLLHKKSGG